MFFEYILTAFFFSMIVNLPDLYVIVKDKKNWVPIMHPPYMIGDDYHYFASMNALFQHIKVFFGYQKESSLAFTIPNYLTLLSLLINLPFYYLGYKIIDRRYAILFVRIFNSFLLYISISVFLLVLNLTGNHSDNYFYTNALALSIFLLHPISFNIKYFLKRSILFNTFNKLHISKYAEANDLVRGIIQSTSAPIFILAISLFVFYIFTYNAMLPFAYILILNLILYFVYSILGSVFFIFVFGMNILFYLFSNLSTLNYIEILMLTLINIILFIGQKMMVSGSTSGNEVFKLEILSPFNLRKYLSVVFTLLFTFSLCFVFDINLTLLLLLGSSLFILFELVLGDHGGRFWTRGMLIVYEILLIYVINNELNFNPIIYNFLFILEFILLIIYFTINANYLYKSKAKTVVLKSNLDFALNSKIDKIIITNSIELIFYLFLYSSKKTLFTHYSLQVNGYKSQMFNLVVVLILLKYSKEEIFNIFHSYNKGAAIGEKSKLIQQLIFMTLYTEYNYQMREDKMIVDGKLDKSFFTYLNDVYGRAIVHIDLMDKDKFHFMSNNGLC